MDLKIFTACNCIIEKVCWRCGCCWEYIFSVLLLFWWPQHDAANARHQHTATLSLWRSLSLRYFGALSPLWFHVRSPVPLKRRAAASLPAAGLRYRTRVSFVSRSLASIRVYYNFSSHDVIARYVWKFIETNTMQSKQSLCETIIPNTRFFARYFQSNKFLINSFLSFCFVSLRLWFFSFGLCVDL